jgi:hypothetical protein
MAEKSFAVFLSEKLQVPRFFKVPMEKTKSVLFLYKKKIGIFAPTNHIDIHF